MTSCQHVTSCITCPLPFVSCRRATASAARQTGVSTHHLTDRQPTWHSWCCVTACEQQCASARATCRAPHAMPPRVTQSCGLGRFQSPSCAMRRTQKRCALGALSQIRSPRLSVRPGLGILRRGRTRPVCGGCRLWSQGGRRSRHRKLQAQVG